jgi:hypothetical protein
MKKYLLSALAFAATAAMATPPGPSGPVININDDSIQTTRIMFSTVKNTASGRSAVLPAA